MSDTLKYKNVIAPGTYDMTIRANGFETIKYEKQDEYEKSEPKKIKEISRRGQISVSANNSSVTIYGYEALKDLYVQIRDLLDWLNSVEEKPVIEETNP